MKRPLRLGPAATCAVALLWIVVAGATQAEQPASKKRSSPAAASTTPPPVQARGSTENKPPVAHAPSGTKIPPAKPATFRGRLPAYFGEVVTDEQRQTIYAIQGEYSERIATLKAQLEAVTKERDGKIDAVLTPQQHDDVDRLREAARQRRKQQRADKQQ